MNEPRIGLSTPVLTLLPGRRGTWEETGTIADVARIARAADEGGLHHMTCSEHVGIPTSEASRRGTRYWDPLATFGYLAAHTEQILLQTHVLVLGYHHPLALAKRYGTLDLVCDERLVLGVGVGTLREEFDLLDAPFDDRGARADDAIDALRASWGVAAPTYHGTHYDFEGLTIDPCSSRTEIPIWIGGRTPISLRRAVERAEGWAPFALNDADVAALLARARDTAAWAERTSPLEVVLGDGGLDPIGAPDRVRDRVGTLAAAGATIVALGLSSTSVEHHVDQVAALAGMYG